MRKIRRNFLCQPRRIPQDPASPVDENQISCTFFPTPHRPPVGRSDVAVSNNSDIYRTLSVSDCEHVTLAPFCRRRDYHLRPTRVNGMANVIGLLRAAPIRLAHHRTSPDARYERNINGTATSGGMYQKNQMFHLMRRFIRQPIKS